MFGSNRGTTSTMTAVATASPVATKTAVAATATVGGHGRNRGGVHRVGAVLGARYLHLVPRQDAAERRRVDPAGSFSVVVVAAFLLPHVKSSGKPDSLPHLTPPDEDSG